MLTNEDLVRTTLISGDPELCQAFLFEIAISYAKEGQYVYYFATKQLESLPPIFHDRSEPSADALKLITFITTPTFECLAGQLVKLHTFQRPASVLLLQDIDAFVDEPQELLGSRELLAARCCAVLLNTAQACARTTGRSVQLCATSFSNGSYAAIYRMYFDNRWLVDAEAEDDSRVTMRRADGGRVLEFCRLDDAVLVLRRVLATDDAGVAEDQ